MVAPAGNATGEAGNVYGKRFRALLLSGFDGVLEVRL